MLLILFFAIAFFIILLPVIIAHKRGFGSDIAFGLAIAGINPLTWIIAFFYSIFHEPDYKD